MPRPSVLFRALMWLLLATATRAPAFAQSISPYHRLEYHQLRWRVFHAPGAHIYFPEGADSLGAFVSKALPGANALIRSRMATELLTVPNIIVYPATDQLYESNAGSTLPTDLTLPTFIVKGNRLLLAYDGSYARLEASLRQALVRATWESQLEGGIQGQVDQTVGCDPVPLWMKEGAIRYFANGWPVAAEEQMLRTAGDTAIRSFEGVIGRRPALAGQALCYFLATRYYPQAPVQLYFLLHKRKPLTRALRLIAKSDWGEVYTACLQFYQQRAMALYANNVSDSGAGGRSSMPVAAFRLPGPKDKVIRLLADDKGNALACIVARPHQRIVYCYYAATRSYSKVMTYALPPWLSDHSTDAYPLLAWTPAGDLLVGAPRKGAIAISRYSATGHLLERYPLTLVDGIGSLSAIDANEVLLAAWRKGQSDIVRYQLLKERYTPYTYDAYDDSDPLLLGQPHEVLFATDRPLTSEQKDTVKHAGLFLQTGAGTKERAISFVVPDSPAYGSWQPLQALGEGRALVRTTIHGKEQYAVISNAAGAPQLTYLQSGQHSVQYLAVQRAIRSWQQQGDSIFVASVLLDEWINAGKDTMTAPKTAWQQDYEAAAALRAREDSILRSAIDTTPSFLSGMLAASAAVQQQAARSRSDSLKEAARFAPAKTSPYILQLYNAYFTARVNNDYFINRYQPYAAYQGQFNFPATGGLAQGGFSDLFEHHHFTIAYRLPAGNEGSDFFVRYNNTARRLDWGLAYYRKVEDLKPDPDRYWVDENGRPYPNVAKVKGNYVELNLKYPLTYYSALGATLAARHDKTYFPATEKYSLSFPAIKSLWSMLTLSYTVYKLRPTLPLLYTGFKAKGLVDVFKGFTGSEAALAGAGLQVEYHQPLYRYITLVGRLSAGTSGGDQKILYNMGGVDNNLTPRVDSNVHFSQSAPYAFQTLVTPLRGYFQNSVYGSSYCLANVDVYFPLFQSLIPLETPLSAINNLQLGLFTDLAAAGGDRRFSSADKSWQTSFGFSARTTLAGYPLRFDMGWPGSFGQKPVWYLSLGVQ